MSKTEDQDRPEQIRRAKSDETETSELPQVFTCPIDGCSRTVIGNPGDLRNHVGQSSDELHRGLKLTADLELVERYKLERDLREQYVEKEKTQHKIADEWGIGRNTVSRWLDKHGIPRREWRGIGAWTRVEYATFYTETAEHGGYEKVGAYDSDRDGMVWAMVHQLNVIMDGEDPYKVFSNGEYQVHHRNGIPWDNRPANLDFLPRRQHLVEHGKRTDMSSSEYLYGEWGHPDWNPKVAGFEELPEEIKQNGVDVSERPLLYHAEAIPGPYLPRPAC